MSRARLHHFMNEFRDPFDLAHTGISGPESGVTLAVPSAGNQLRLYRAIISAPSEVSTTQEVEIRDGDTVLHRFFVTANQCKQFDALGRYIPVDSLVIGRPDNQELLYATLLYREVPND